MAKYNKKYRRGRYRNSGEGWPDGMLAGQGPKYNGIGGPSTATGGAGAASSAEDIWSTSLWGEYRLADGYFTASGGDLASWSAYTPASRAETLDETAAGFGPTMTGAADADYYLNYTTASERLIFTGGGGTGPDLQEFTCYIVAAPDDTVAKKTLFYNAFYNIQVNIHNASTKMPQIRWGAGIYSPTTTTLTSGAWFILRFSARASDNKKSIRIYGSGVDEEYTDTTAAWGGGAATAYDFVASSNPFLGKLGNCVLLDAYFDSADSRDDDTFAYLNGLSNYLGF